MEIVDLQAYKIVEIADLQAHNSVTVYFQFFLKKNVSYFNLFVTPALWLSGNSLTMPKSITKMWLFLLNAKYAIKSLTLILLC